VVVQEPQDAGVEPIGAVAKGGKGEMKEEATIIFNERGIATDK